MNINLGTNHSKWIFCQNEEKNKVCHLDDGNDHFWFHDDKGC